MCDLYVSIDGILYSRFSNTKYSLLISAIRVIIRFHRITQRSIFTKHYESIECFFFKCNYNILYNCVSTVLYM